MPALEIPGQAAHEEKQPKPQATDAWAHIRKDQAEDRAKGIPDLRLLARSHAKEKNGSPRE
jgi:hypothetical protein